MICSVVSFDREHRAAGARRSAIAHTLIEGGARLDRLWGLRINVSHTQFVHPAQIIAFGEL